MVSLSHRLLVLVALGAVLWSAPAHAQSSTGRLEGLLRDTTGAPLPGATVTITGPAATAAQSVTTGADGRYSASVAPGIYTVGVSLRGFGRQSRSNLTVTAGGTTTSDFDLRPEREEEVTVTVMRREEALQDTPVSVAAATADVLRARGAATVEDIAANVAGFSVQNLGPGQSQVAVRGVSSGQVARDQPGVKEQVGSYLDDSVISLSLFTPEVDLFDVSRVELLRGPQGTLFGSGSESGTLRYITNQPEPNVTRLFGEIGGNAVQNGNQGGNVKLGLNAPLGGRTALRVAGYWNRLPGYVDAVQPDGSVEKDVNTGSRSGVRAALKVNASDRLTITPRVMYQEQRADGWNRVDAYNILANPYTTTRPAVRLGPREQYTQIEEPFFDKFTLADLNLTATLGEVLLTSITSYTHRDIDVLRDAGALTSSITGGSIGLPPNVYTLDSPLDDRTKASAFTQELRLSGSRDRLFWVAGGFYAHTRRHYGQNLFVKGFEQLTGIPTAGLRAPKDSLYWSDLHYGLDQIAGFGEVTWSAGSRVTLTAGLRYYHFGEDKEQVFDGIFANDDTGRKVVSQPGTTSADGVAPRLILKYRLTDDTNLDAQVSRGFRLGGINDPINAPLCTAQDLATFGGRESWRDEKAWNYELGTKSRLLQGKGSFNVSAFYMDIRDLQATVTAGSCSSRLVFNVPKSRSTGAEAELTAAPNQHFDFALSASYDDAQLRSTLTSTDASGRPSVVSGIESGARLPSVPRFQGAAAATYQWAMRHGTLGYVTGVFQHVGSRLTQVGDQDLGTLDLTSFGANAIGGPLSATTFSYDPVMPAYDVVNVRVGLRREKWEIALFGDNLTDERALLSLDRERGTRARISFLTNRPRSFGISLRFEH